MRIASLAFALALGLSLSACKTVGDFERLVSGKPETPVIDRVANAPAFAPAPERRRKDIGTLLSAADGMPDEPQIDAYLNGVLAKLAAKSPRDVSAARVYLFADPFPGAFAYSSGAIFISHGMLDKLRNEDELAFVLGHELGHVALDHFGSEWLETLQRYALVAGEAVISAKAQQGGGNQAIPGWYVVGSLGTIMTRDMISPARSRSDEDEADQFGVDVMVRAGYNPAGSVSVMGLVRQAELEYGTGDAVNLTVLETLVQEGLAKQTGKDDLISKGIETLGKGIAAAQRDWRRNHKTAEERILGLNAYIDKWYEAVQPPPLAQASLEAAKAAPATRHLLTSYEQARTFKDDIKAVQSQALKPKDAKRQMAALEARLAALTSGAVQHDNYVRMQLADLWYGGGNRERAKAELERALSAPHASVKAYMRLAGLQSESGQYKQAAALLDAAAQRFEDPPALYPPRIRAYAKAGDRDRAGLLAVQCVLAHPQMNVTCQQAAKSGI